MKKIFKIEGMHCSSCVMLIDMELEELEGVRSTKTSYQRGQTEVEFDDNEPEDKEIIEAVERAGYKVSAVV